MINFVDINITRHTLRELLFSNPFESQLVLPPDLDPAVDVRAVRLVDSGKVQTLGN